MKACYRAAQCLSTSRSRVLLEDMEHAAESEEESDESLWNRLWINHLIDPPRPKRRRCEVIDLTD